MKHRSDGQSLILFAMLLTVLVPLLLGILAWSEWLVRRDEVRWVVASEIRRAISTTQTFRPEVFKRCPVTTATIDDVKAAVGRAIARLRWATAEEQAEMQRTAKVEMMSDSDGKCIRGASAVVNVPLPVAPWVPLPRWGAVTVTVTHAYRFE